MTNQQAAPKAAPKQEPTFWTRQLSGQGREFLKQKPFTTDWTPLYTAPQPAPAPLSDDVVKDAARYRWLRTNAIGAFRTNNGKGPVSVYHLSKIPALPGIPEETDAAIDAALAAQGGK